MTLQQSVLFVILVLVFVMLIWGRWRYDLVAFIALMVALLTGVVPVSEAFSGFGHPATVIIALVLVVSRGLSNSGVIELLARYLIDASRKLVGARGHHGRAGGVAVGGDEQRGGACVADAARSAGREEKRSQSFAVADGAVVCVDPRRHDHA